MPIGRLERTRKSYSRPTYNHTRGDSHLTPCSECAALANQFSRMAEREEEERTDSEREAIMREAMQ